MSDKFVIGLDYGTESARGVLIDAVTGSQVAHHTHPYRHGVITHQLACGSPIAVGYALQDPADYLEAAEAILSKLGGGRHVLSIGIDFTASSPLPVLADGTPLSQLYPRQPHAYVKLWKHSAAQPYADSINAKGGAYLNHCGGKLSGEWMLAKAAQVAAEAPEIWNETGRYIESGDWLVWQLTDREVRSKDFANFKAHYTDEAGYPEDVVPGLLERLTEPSPVGSPAGPLTAGWHERTGIVGPTVVGIAVIDSHVVLPAVGAVSPGTLVGALGTSAVFLLLEEEAQALPSGIEAMAYGAALPGLWCFEAGQAGFGDMLSWFVRTFPRADDLSENFRSYNTEAASLSPGKNHLVALDWWNGNRVPYGDSALSGVLAGLNMGTTAAGIYRALVEALCFGARTIIDHMINGGLAIHRIILTSGLAQNSPLLVQTMADVFQKAVEVPDIQNPTAVGAAIHGAVAGRVVRDFAEGAARLGKSTGQVFYPDAERGLIYERLYQVYRNLGASTATQSGLHDLRQIATGSMVS